MANLKLALLKLALLGAVILAPPLVVVAAQGTGTREAPASIVVPPGHVGDRGVYTRYARASDSDLWEPIETQSFFVEAIERTMNETGALRPSVVVRWGAAESHPVVSSTSVDLETRHAIRRDQVENPGAGASGYDTDFGPHVRPTWFRTPFADSSLLRFQGRSFIEGSDLTDATRVGFEHDWGLAQPNERPPPMHTWGDAGTPHAAQEGSVVDYRARVEGPATLDGRPVLELRFEGRAKYNVTAETAIRFDSEGVPLLSFLLPFPKADVRFSRTLWLSSDTPYPVLVRDEVREGDRLHESLRYLSELEAGPRAIPWGPASGARDAVIWQRAPAGQMHPADGESSFCYPLSRALKDLGEDPTKFQFREWQAAHPQHFLVGASGFCQAPREGIWQVLLFAAPNGSAWWATIRNAPPAARTENVVMLAGAPEYEGEWTIPPFRPEELPDQLVVIAAAEQAWRAYASEEYLARGLNWIGWGLSGTVTLPDAKKVPVRELDSLAIVSVGTFRYESSAENPTATNASRLRIDAIEGRLHAAEEGQGRWSSVPFFTSYAVERLGGPAPAVGSREAAPDSYKDVALAVAVASSLLGVALFAYFLPLIRWLEPHLLAFVPSYAKLRREALLDHKTRDQLLGRIRADPGVSPPELRRDSSIGWSTLVYHLSVLEKNKLISSIIDGRHKRLFPVDSLDWSRRPALAALRNRNTKRFYELVLEEPGITQRELAGRVGMTHAGGLWHLQRLEHAGLLLREKRGHKVHYYANERGATPLGYDPKAAVEVA